MNTSLTNQTEKAVVNLAHAFDGYVYAKRAWSAPEQDVHAALGRRLAQVQESDRLFLNVEDNFAVNFYLHRTFYHWGWLPEAKSAEWYTMLFFYLHLYRVPVPATYRNDSGYADWTRRPKGAAEAAAAELRLVLRH